MKKIIFLYFGFFCFLATYSQKTIENPLTGFTNASYIKIQKIELTDTSTAIHFHVTFRPRWWINVPEKTYIQPVGSDQRLYIISAEGININQRFTMPESGETSYVLYFPPLDPDVQIIDFGEEVASQNPWFIYDIEIIPKPWNSLIPELFRGHWFRTDGSNSWDFGFSENMAIFNSDIWKFEKLEQKGKLYSILLKNENGDLTKIYARSGKKGSLYMGTKPGKLLPYSREYTYDKNYRLINDEDFPDDIFSFDSAVYRGMIFGYTPRAGKNTGLVYVNNIFDNEQDTYLMEIRSDGTFELKIPVLYPNEVMVRSLAFNGSVYLEPGKTTFHLINGGDNLFMGECAKVNADLSATRNISSYNPDKVLKNVLDMSPKEYKDYIMETLKSDQEAFNTYKESNQVSVKAAKIRDLGYLYNCYSHLFEFNMMRRSASRRQSSTPNVQPQVQLPPLPLTPDFYAFPEELPVNDLVSVVSSAYKIFINRLKFAQMTENRRMPGTYEIIGMLEERGAEVPPAVKEAARAQSEMQNNPDQEKAEQILNDKYGTVVKDFWTENQAPIREVINTWQYNLRDSFLKSTFNVEKGFAMDIMKCQDQVQALKSSFEPFPEDVLNSFDEMFGLNIMANFIRLRNQEIITKIEENKHKTGYSIVETPVTEADKIFDEIMSKYRGKVVMVDFWATWCGPCISGIKTIASLKEEMKDQDVTFVYITNQTSPETAWKNMIPDIKGDHYRLSQDEWNHISGKFNISGIPHYTLVNKEGEVLIPHFRFMGNQMLKEKLIELLD